MKTYFNTSNKNNYLKYFSYKSINEKVKLPKDNPPISNIVSFNSHITLGNYYINKNKILITYYIIYKILYSSMPNNITYILKNKKIGYTELLIPEKIRGENMDNISSRNGISLQCNIIDNNIVDFDENSVKVHSSVLVMTDIYELHSIAYIIKFSDFEEYLYTSYEYGEKLIQKTFDSNTHYEKINFAYKNYILCIIENENKKFLRRIFLESEDYEDIYENDDLKDFDILDDENILMVIENSQGSKLLKFNLDTLEYYSLCDFPNNSISYIKCLKDLIILSRNNYNIDFLSFINYDGMIFSNIKGAFSHINISPCHTLALVCEHGYAKIINLISKEIYYLSKNLITGELINSHFLDCQKVIVHIKLNDKEILSIINISNNSSEIILETPYTISDFLINKETNTIYYSLSKNNNKYNIYSIDYNKNIKTVFDIDAMNIHLLSRC